MVARALAAGILWPTGAQSLGEKEKLDLIFSPGLTTSHLADSLSGRGLGLAIALEKARAEGGDVTVESSPESGTRFTIVIPD